MEKEAKPKARAAFKKPDHWTDEPVPEPSDAPKAVDDEAEELSPTRYGDWEKNGIAIDF